MTDEESWAKYRSAKDLKAKQAELTRLANGLLNQTKGGIFSAKDNEKLREAAKILQSFKQQVEHAKERKAREEKAEKARNAASAKKAAKLLHQATSALSLPDKVKLLVNDDGDCKWPWNSLARLLEALNQLGYQKTVKRIEQEVRYWVDDAGSSMSFRAHSTFNPEPITEEFVQRKIQSAINGGGREPEPISFDEVFKRMDELKATESFLSNLIKD